MAFSQTLVTQSYGAGSTGTVTFLADRPMTNGVDFAGMGAATVGTLDGSGNLSVLVPSTMDAGTAPQNARMRVHERINGTNRIYYVQVPTSGPVTLGSLGRTDDSLPAPGVLTDRYLMATSPATPRALTIDREAANGSLVLTSGKAQFVAFTALATMTIGSLSAFVRGTAAATITLARLGLYTVAADGSITLVARGASSTTLGNATFAAAPQALDTTGGYPASYTLQQGTRYAFGALWVATTPPALYAALGSAAVGLWLPWQAASLSAQSDLPTSVAVGSLVADGNALLLGAY